MAWEFNSREAIFLQMANRLRAEIICGRYAPDAQFPAVRQLAEEAAVNPNTVQKALASLEEEGLLYTKTTVGRFVTPDTAVIGAAKERMRRDAVRNFIAEASQLGITKEELISYIKEEEEI
ncbi:MAG: GntR family transcriptional regulator [Clostridia bacterium]|nr:GntR family transcriptional regulator [Clostridia bacterium]